MGSFSNYLWELIFDLTKINIFHERLVEMISARLELCTNVGAVLRVWGSEFWKKESNLMGLPISLCLLQLKHSFKTGLLLFNIRIANFRALAKGRKAK